MDVCMRLMEAADDLPAILRAAHEIFEWMLAVLEGHEDTASPVFAAVVLAATAAADGRDSVAGAPSWQARHVAERSADDDRDEPAAADARWPQSAGLFSAIFAGCDALASRLRFAAELAGDQDDRTACIEAARYAAKVGRLLAGIAR